jgi:hypothetical protein
MLRQKKRIMEHYPLQVEWRKHLGFTRPMARNSKGEHNPENAVVREYMLAVMKQWCRDNIPEDSESNKLHWDVRAPWCYFENKFRFKFENHKMAFLMEFRCKGNELEQQGRELFAKGHLKIKAH